MRKHPARLPAATLILLAIGFIASFGPAHAGEYVRFLSNDGNCVYPAKGLLRQWPAGGPRELWRVKLGEGKSAVLEAGGRAFTATQAEGKQWAVCLNPANGKTIWRHEILNKENNHVAKGPVSSPVIDGDRIYFIPYKNNNGDIFDIRCPVYCLRVRDGSEVWNSGDRFVSTEGSTPLIHGNTLYVSSNGRQSVLAAVDKMTGQVLWKVPETADTGVKTIFGSAASVTWQMLGAVPTVVLWVFRNDCMGVDARNGKVLWHWAAPKPVGPGVISTPLAVGSRLFISGFQGPSFGTCLEIGNKDGAFEPRVRYTSDKIMCNTYHTVSLLNGAMFGFGRGTKNDALQCVNFEDGKLLWEKEGPEWSRECNMTVADGLIFALTRQEELVLAEANKTGYKELGRVNPGIKLGYQQQPMIYGGRLYLRGNDTVVCYQIK